MTTYGYNVTVYKTTRYSVVVAVVVYLVICIAGGCDGGNCYWYRLAGILYGYLDWGNYW